MKQGSQQSAGGPRAVPLARVGGGTASLDQPPYRVSQRKRTSNSCSYFVSTAALPLDLKLAGSNQATDRSERFVSVLLHFECVDEHPRPLKCGTMCLPVCVGPARGTGTRVYQKRARCCRVGIPADVDCAAARRCLSALWGSEIRRLAGGRRRRDGGGCRPRGGEGPGSGRVLPKRAEAPVADPDCVLPTSLYLSIYLTSLFMICTA